MNSKFSAPPTAESVGARPNTWNPGITEIGGLRCVAPAEIANYTSSKKIHRFVDQEVSGMVTWIPAPAQSDDSEELLDNNYFVPRHLVNQRRQTVYETTWAMTIDRWYLANTTDANATMTLTDAGIMLASSRGTPYIQQRIVKIDTSKDYTFAWCDVSGHIAIENLTAAQIQVNMQTYGFLPVSIMVTSGTTLKWASLRPGIHTAETFPRPVSRQFSAELAECRRWYLGMDAARWYEITRPLGDLARFTVVGSFYNTPKLLGTPRVYLGDGWHDLAANWTDTFPDRIVFRFDIPSDLMAMGGTYLLSGVSGVTCEL